MKCSTCKQQIEPSSMFCPYCGTRTVQANSDAVSTGLPQIEYPSRPSDLPSVEQSNTDYSGPVVSTVPAPSVNQATNPSVPNAQPNLYTNNTFYNQAQAPTSAAAVISLVLGILSCFGLAFIGSLGGIVAGHIARKNIRESGGTLRGDGMALAGLIISYATLILSILGCVAMMLFMVASDF
jgi:hypothetical protein